MQLPIHWKSKIKHDNKIDENIYGKTLNYIAQLYISIMQLYEHELKHFKIMYFKYDIEKYYNEFVKIRKYIVPVGQTYIL